MAWTRHGGRKRSISFGDSGKGATVFMAVPGKKYIKDKIIMARRN